MYILNLALVDFLYCSCTLCVLGLHYFGGRGGWPLGDLACTFTVFLKVSVMFLDWLSLALITSSRYVLLCLSSERRSAFYASGWMCAAPVCLVWGITLLVFVPVAVQRVSAWDIKEGLQSFHFCTMLFSIH